MMIKVLYTDCQLYAYITGTQPDPTERIYCMKYRWGPKISISFSVSKMAAVSRSDCWIFLIFMQRQHNSDITDFDQLKTFVKIFFECR